MTREAFLIRLAAVVGGGLVLAALLRLGLGPRWFSFYGWATVALATALPVALLLYRRLPHTGHSRWWSLAVAVPAFVASVVQIAFWVAFFGPGTRNPMFGTGRELVRPWLEAGEPFLLAVYGLISAWLIAEAGRPRTGV